MSRSARWQVDRLIVMRPIDDARAAPPAQRVRFWVRLLGLVLAGSIAVGCPCVRGAVNASPGLRWWLFSTFGAERMCPEMLKRGAALKLAPTGNTIGRFFPTRCQHNVNDQAQTVTLYFGGTGSAWTPLAGRVGFAAEASVEYGMDFYMAEDAMYVWAKTRRILQGPDFKVGSIENKLADWAARSPVGYMANLFGSQIVSSQLASGFTVVHSDEGDEFALGILQPPARPKKPFDTSDGDRYVFANETTEVRNGQVDFLGPLEVPDSDQALFFRFRLQGPPIDVLLIRRTSGDMWREGLQKGAALGPPPELPLYVWQINAGAEQRRKIKVPAGQYYAVLDNSAVVGAVSPPWNPLSVVGGNLALVSYTAEVGDDDDDF
jgi:hypothetical protein